MKNGSRKPPASVFLAAIIVIFFSSLSAADSIGFVPDYIDGTAPVASSNSDAPTSLALASLPVLGDATASSRPALPTRIVIKAIGMDLPVQNPNTTDVNTLDALLQKGPARYVDSAKLGAKGNMIIFAHSSHLPVVHNQMYKAFNRVPELAAGDIITLTGDDGNNYLYTVKSVREADATDTTIDLAPTDGTHLTLVTCDTLTGKSARFILDAEYVGLQ